MSISTKSPIGAALNDRNWGYIQNRISKRFDCEVKLDEVEEVFSAERDTALLDDEDSLGHGWSDSTWIMWLKRRVEFPCHGEEDMRGGSFPFRCFFITIPVDLKKLGNLSDDPQVAKSKVARSKISSSQLPSINRTASIVANKRTESFN